MKSKHPSSQHPLSLQSSDNTLQISFTEEQVRNAVKSFRKGSAPGPDGLRAEHLKVAIKLAPPNRQDKTGETLTGLVNRQCYE